MEARTEWCLPSKGRAPKPLPAGVTVLGGWGSAFRLCWWDCWTSLYTCLLGFFRKGRNASASVLIPGAASTPSLCPAVSGLFLFHHTCSQLRSIMIWFQPRARASKTLALLSLRSSRLPIPNPLPDAPSSRPCKHLTRIMSQAGRGCVSAALFSKLGNDNFSMDCPTSLLFQSGELLLIFQVLLKGHHPSASLSSVSPCVPWPLLMSLRHGPPWSFIYILFKSLFSLHMYRYQGPEQSLGPRRSSPTACWWMQEWARWTLIG